MNNNELSKIDLVFENCEYESIPINNIDAFSMDDITKELNIYQSTSLYEMDTFDSFFMRIKSEGNVLHKGLMDNGKDDMPLFDRIQKWNDITQIELHFLDNIPPQTYFVKYKEGERGANIWQHTWIDELGNLWIVISKDKSYLKRLKNFSDKYYIKDRSKLNDKN